MATVRVAKTRVMIGYNQRLDMFLLIVGVPGEWTRLPYDDATLRAHIATRKTFRFFDEVDNLFVCKRARDGKWYLSPGEQVLQRLTSIEAGQVPRLYVGTDNTLSLEKLQEARQSILAL